MPETFPSRACPFHGDASRTEPGLMTRVTLRGGREVWAASRHAEVRAVLTDPSLSANRYRPDFPSLNGQPLKRPAKFSRPC
jgi:cytochrome P450